MNELWKLKKQNDRLVNQLNTNLQYECHDLCNYLRYCPSSLFERELIRKELIGMAFEAQESDERLREHLGMPIQEFIRETVKNMPSTSRSLRAAEICTASFAAHVLLWLVCFIAVLSDDPFWVEKFGNFYISHLLLFLLFPCSHLICDLLYTPFYFKAELRGDLDSFLPKLPYAIFLLFYILAPSSITKFILFPINPAIPLIVCILLTLLFALYSVQQTSKLASQTNWAD